METKNRKLVDQLKEILEKNIDAKKGYAKAAENAESSGLKAYFKTKSRERMQFNEELNMELVAAYDEIQDDGSATGTMHRTWMDIKSFFSGNNDESMLEESIRGDKAAVEEYKEVLENTALAPRIASLLRDQHKKISADLDQNRTLEDLEK
jgi:uncharacterized protein (TIGR02284 family)